MKLVLTLISLSFLPTLANAECVVSARCYLTYPEEGSGGEYTNDFIYNPNGKKLEVVYQDAQGNPKTESENFDGTPHSDYSYSNDEWMRLRRVSIRASEVACETAREKYEKQWGFCK
jgi:hypothetical protein